ncbi:hypothetical protein LC605_12215 [Nostoc sp. CHAB 5836]|uniref:hypothetical protein n=1 Tax=Nostoc sp. CHAB 5836 TaxID=2780404 RepID=UPI001E60E929|nr:hypothetical protein [Nostoc sp. CHAB 5836]MCC5615819.1 hypothetical protein [Nostoc sp. CHAB 5836]
MENNRTIWKKYFRSSWTKDTINGGIDEEVFAASKKQLVILVAKDQWGCGGMVDATDLDN